MHLSATTGNPPSHLRVDFVLRGVEEWYLRPVLPGEGQEEWQAEDEEVFAVITTVLPSGVLEVLVVGEVDLLTAPRLLRPVLDELDGYAGRPPAEVELVLNGVTFIDSTGVVALLDLSKAVCARGARVRLVAPSAAVRYVLDISGLAAYFEVR